MPDNKPYKQPNLLGAIGKGTYKAAAAEAGRVGSQLKQSLNPLGGAMNGVYSIPIIGPVLENILSEVQKGGDSKDTTRDEQKHKDVTDHQKTAQAQNTAMLSSLQQISSQLGTIAVILSSFGEKSEAHAQALEKIVATQSHQRLLQAIQVYEERQGFGFGRNKRRADYDKEGVQRDENLPGQGTSLAGGIAKFFTGGDGGFFSSTFGKLLAGAGILGALSQTESFKEFWKHSDLGPAFERTFDGIKESIKEGVKESFSGLGDVIGNTVKETLYNLNPFRDQSIGPDGQPISPTENLSNINASAADVAGAVTLVKSYQNQTKANLANTGKKKRVRSFIKGLGWAWLVQQGTEMIIESIEEENPENAELIGTAVQATASGYMLYEGAKAVKNIVTKTADTASKVATTTSNAAKSVTTTASNITNTLNNTPTGQTEMFDDKGNVKDNRSNAQKIKQAANESAKKLNDAKKSALEKLERLLKKFPKEKVMNLLMPKLKKILGWKIGVFTVGLAGLSVPGPGWVVSAISGLMLAADIYLIATAIDEVYDMLMKEEQEGVKADVSTIEPKKDFNARMGIPDGGDEFADIGISDSLDEWTDREPNKVDTVTVDTKQVTASERPSLVGNNEVQKLVTNSKELVDAINPAAAANISPAQINNDESTSGITTKFDTERNQIMKSAAELQQIISGATLGQSGGSKADPVKTSRTQTDGSGTTNDNANPTFTNEQLLKSGILSDMNYLNP